MTTTALRSAPDSRNVLRALMWITAAMGFLFLPASLRSAPRLAAEQHRFVSLWIALTPWVAMSVAAIIGSASQFEDAVFRRRVVTAIVLAAPFPVMGVAIHYFVPNFRLLSNGLQYLWMVYWLPSLFGFMPFNGAGPWVDGRLTRWFGPPNASETTMRERERQIRDAATQEERNRLAQDLHDSIKQEIFAIHTSAATAQARLSSDPDGARQALEQIRNSSRDAMTEMEALLDRLNPTPLENTGLVNALKKQCEALALRTGAIVDCRIGQLPDSSQLPPGAHEALFRIAQEALSNIGKHARADRVDVSLELAERDLLLTIRDNGRGFEPWGKDSPASGMGIANMRARAAAVGGQFGLVTSPGRGVVLRVGVIVLSKTNFGFSEMSRTQRWVLGTLAAALAAPALIAAYMLVFKGSIGWDVWLIWLPLLIAVMILDGWRRSKRGPKTNRGLTW